MANYNEAKIFSGHRATLMIDGKPVGYAQGITWQADFGVVDAPILGSYTVAEHQGTVFRVSGSIQRYRVRGTAKVRETIDKRSSDAVSKQGLFDMEVKDDTGEIIAYLRDVTLASKSSGVQIGALVTEATAFRAIDVQDPE